MKRPLDRQVTLYRFFLLAEIADRMTFTPWVGGPTDPGEEPYLFVSPLPINHIP